MSKYLRVGGRARGHVLVDWRRLVVPADADASPLCQDAAEVHPQNSSDAGVGDQGRLADRRPLLGNNHLHHKLMRNFGAVAALGVADRFGVLGQEVVQLDFDAAVCGARIVALPARKELLLADDASLGAGNPLLRLLLSVGGLGGVLLTCWCYRLDRLLELPCQLLKLPVLHGLDLDVVLGDAVKPDGQLVAAGGMDDVRIVNVGLDVGWRKDADRVVRRFGRRETTLNLQELLQPDGRLSGPVSSGKRLYSELVSDCS